MLISALVAFVGMSDVVASVDVVLGNVITALPEPAIETSPVISN